MDDMISRQAAIDVVMEKGKRIPTYAILCKDAIENLPSAQPERKTGHWIPQEGWDGDELYECSECGFATIYEGRKTCPSCNAEMAGVK